MDFAAAPQSCLRSTRRSRKHDPIRWGIQRVRPSALVKKLLEGESISCSSNLIRTAIRDKIGTFSLFPGNIEGGCQYPFTIFCRHPKDFRPKHVIEQEVAGQVFHVLRLSNRLA